MGHHPSRIWVAVIPREGVWRQFRAGPRFKRPSPVVCIVSRTCRRGSLTTRSRLVLVGPEWHEIWARMTTLFPERLLRQARAGITLRSAFAEEHLFRSGCAQYVMLGAGLDSFAWRRPDLIADLILFEVDHPASQGWKRQRVIDLGLPVGSRHLFAPVDFESESIR